ncbi:hypothetical protein A6V36_04195 [Paraburkholderia ginsengiterrae]|uniref:Uncharacterized protein n=1 Tax=Paraburkholderia ginsengiterrae TaxID=1462993 RepID=A0ABX2UTX3_9BURK|nr:hypothetical protein [Paraburkholderia ginsengiterrae]OAJ58145.1 hypothetical protein A6V36_04195 [Paraburkholderia ginsengiterrae]
MSTIPFTPIVGYLALPRLRPLSQLPAPFGCDWALLPPGYSLRAELKALYAALLRTFCMSDQAIRSFCQWSPLEESHAPMGAAAVARPAVSEAPHGVAAQVANETVTTPWVVGSANYWTALAGGACALGGAAVLAWIGVDHLTHRHTITHANYPSTGSTQHDSQPATLRKPTTAPTHADRASNASGLVAASAPAYSGAASARTTAPSPVGAFAPTTASVPASPAALPMAAPHFTGSQAVSPRRKPIGDKAASERNQNQRHKAHYVATKHATHVTTNTADTSRFTTPKSLAHVSPRPSAAGPFSPLSPARLGVDEYADVAVSASTHLRDIPRAPRSASANAPSATSRTEWMNHLSQRRVTEVPEQFAK